MFEPPKAPLPNETIVFVSKRPPKTDHPNEFANFEHMHEDDELVYAPKLQFAHVPGKKSLVFEGLLDHSYCRFFLDSGATHSVVSLDFVQTNHVKFTPTSHYSASMADGTGVSIHGVVRDLHIKFGAFRVKSTFLVVDVPKYDAVLGMDFLHRHNPVLNWRKRYMDLTLPTRHGSRQVHVAAYREGCEVPSIDSKTFELCSLDAFAKSIRRDSHDDIDDAFIACVTPVMNSVDASNAHESSGLGSTHPGVTAIIQEYSDVLVSQIPGGLPPEGLDAHGRPIEHTIETDPNVAPFKRSARPFTAEEDAEIKRYIADFMAKG